jgi:hypothetical protein
MDHLIAETPADDDFSLLQSSGRDDEVEGLMQLLREQVRHVGVHNLGGAPAASAAAASLGHVQGVFGAGHEGSFDAAREGVIDVPAVAQPLCDGGVKSQSLEVGRVLCAAPHARALDAGRKYLTHTLCCRRWCSSSPLRSGVRRAASLWRPIFCLCQLCSRSAQNCNLMSQAAKMARCKN